MKAERTRRERLITFLLLPAIVLAVLVLGGGSIRASFQLDKLREQAVVEASLELANERATRLDQKIIEQDNAVLGEADPEHPELMAEAWLRISDRQTPTVRAVLIIDLAGSEHEVLAYASRAPGQTDDEFRRLLLYDVWGELRLGEPIAELRHLHKDFRDQNYLISYAQKRAGGQNYLIVAWHDVARLVHDTLPYLYGEKDTQSRVNVVDAQGRRVFGPALSGGEFTVGRHFQTTLYKWRLNVALTRAEELAGRAERRRLLETALAALSALVVIAGSIVVLTAASRERRLANLKGEFVANVSHELKTPLSLIRMFSELLQTGRVGSEAKRDEYVGIIVSESERLSGLIENVLDFARVERGEEAYQFKQAHLEPVIQRAAEVCRVRADREQATIELTIEPRLPPTKLDERALEIAVINLIDNALKYAAEGRWVGVEARRSGRRRLELVVRDRGAGVPPEDRSRIFERFVRRASKNIRGSGIGLALVQHVAAAHGGRAWVDDNPGGGCAFHFTLRC